MGASLDASPPLHRRERRPGILHHAAAAFGSLSLWGYTTNRSLSGMGSFLHRA